MTYEVAVFIKGDLTPTIGTKYVSIAGSVAKCHAVDEVTLDGPQGPTWIKFSFTLQLAIKTSIDNIHAKVASGQAKCHLFGWLGWSLSRGIKNRNQCQLIGQ